MAALATAKRAAAPPRDDGAALTAALLRGRVLPAADDADLFGGTPSAATGLLGPAGRTTASALTADAASASVRRRKMTSSGGSTPAGLRSAEDAIAYFLTHGSSTPVKFVCLKHRYPPGSDIYRPYNLVVVPAEDVGEHVDASPTERSVMEACARIHSRG